MMLDHIPEDRVLGKTPKVERTLGLASLTKSSCATACSFSSCAGSNVASFASSSIEVAGELVPVTSVISMSESMGGTALDARDDLALERFFGAIARVVCRKLDEERVTKSFSSRFSFSLLPFSLSCLLREQEIGSICTATARSLNFSLLFLMTRFLTFSSRVYLAVHIPVTLLVGKYSSFIPYNDPLTELCDGRCSSYLLRQIDFSGLASSALVRSPLLPLSARSFLTILYLQCLCRTG